jgi:hypothetical protein
MTFGFPISNRSSSAKLAARHGQSEGENDSRQISTAKKAGTVIHITDLDRDPVHDGRDRN